MTHGTVLVVDDDPDIQACIGAALEEEGYRVRVAVGSAALRIAAEQLPQVILLDLMMPGMSGQEVCQRLRDQPRTAHIPIVAMSTAPARHALPADDFLPKPFELATLYRVVARWAAVGREGTEHPRGGRRAPGVAPRSAGAVRTLCRPGGSEGRGGTDTASPTGVVRR